VTEVEGFVFSGHSPEIELEKLLADNGKQSVIAVHAGQQLSIFVYHKLAGREGVGFAQGDSFLQSRLHRLS